ncbi:involucrin-like isoform X2 [Diorhabda carinulata]|uniref:involucrin-like isoform X2 n=1 Tax=Diorhabda carinulata TaxID=1163345 RepID=UPI0025A25E69|nr:involucrin-like isoform X2 [Diorhabda carinulata]
MTNEICKPCEVDELQAWKCMMDSMVKFIQASTKLMNTFNEKSNPQIEDSTIDCKAPCKLQFSLPKEDSTTSSDCKAPCNSQGNTSKEDKLEEGRSCHKDCKAYNPQKNPKCEKCDEKANEEEKESKLCHPECKLCLPSRAPICKKCPTGSDQSLKESKNGSKSGEIVNRESQTEEKCPCPTDIKPKKCCTCPKEENQTEETQTIDGSQSEEKGKEEEINPEEDQNPPKTEEVDEEKVEDADSPPEKVDEEVQKEEEQKEEEQKDEEQKEEEQKEGGEKKQPLVDCSCQYSDSEIKPVISCNCEQLRKEEEERKQKEVICSCPLSSEEKLSITNRMQEKLEIAQQEINQLRKEIEQLQFAELTKHTNSARLYKEIMKESVLDNSFNTSAAQRSKSSRREVLCPILRNKFSAPQQQTFNRDRSFNMQDPANRQVPGSPFGQTSRLDRTKFQPLKSSSLAGNDLLNGTQSDPAGRQVSSPNARCNNSDQICVRRSKQQRRSQTFNKTATYQTSTKSSTPDYSRYQQPMDTTMKSLYSYYGSQGGLEEEQYCDCKPRAGPQQGCGCNTQNNYINDNYNSDDESY